MPQDPTMVIFAAIAASLISGIVSYTIIVNTKLTELSKQKSDEAEHLIIDLAILFSEVELIVRLIEKDAAAEESIPDSMILSLRKDNKEHYQQLLEKLAALRIRIGNDAAGKDILQGLDRLENSFWGRCDNLNEIHSIQRELSQNAREYCRNLISESERTAKFYKYISLGAVLVLMVALFAVGAWIYSRTGNLPPLEGRAIH